MSIKNSYDTDAVFQLVKRGDIDATEVERSDRSVTELSILWQTAILRVVHLSATESFSLSSEGLESDRCMVVDGSMLPESSVAMSVVSNGSFVFAPNVAGELSLDGAKLSLSDAVSQGVATQRADGSIMVSLRSGMRCKMSVGSLTVSAKTVAEGRKVAGRARRDPAMIASTLGALVAIGSMMGMGYATSANSGSLVSDSGEERMADIMGLVNRSRERSPEPQPTQPQASESAPSAQGAAARGESGVSGTRASTATNRRLSVRDNNLPPQLSRQSAREITASRGIFAALGAPVAATNGASGPVSPFGGLTESGHDSASHWGNLSGDSIGDAFGMNGLGNTGTGVGQGGNGEGTVCSGSSCGMSTLGVGGSPNGDRYGQTTGNRLGPRQGHGPRVTAASPNVIGEYDRGLIRRVVLRNLSQVTHCHEQGLLQNSQLAGRVVVSFVIDPAGNVSGSSVRESSLAVPATAQCIANAVRRWQFPSPQGSAIVVNYPFTLEHAM
ncbi:MAG: AgmX/PglI C-terminal domain-containing protein [Deltaproteobacteria bacterium]|nr:AgmX/PglI C-terminal domain-containing protein [Deltaproteobacteria bacterium]